MALCISLTCWSSLLMTLVC
uniref:Uncharacterized protein n=1 Tax=Anguilla anguilla TaxID=7936 RepID=A0A0E9UXP9_ANGAN